MKILFLVPYPSHEAPSQRFRFEQYFQHLKLAGYTFHIHSFLSLTSWRIFYSKGRVLKKIWILIQGVVRRTGILLSLPSYNFVFIHREVAPFGPPIFEWIIAKVFRKKIIYDFDDAIWMTDKTSEQWLERTIRWRNKIAYICKWSYRVSCGNEYLCSFARQFNQNVILNPTTIDTGYVHNRELSKEAPQNKADGKLIIGWTGSHSTLKYLKLIEPALQKLEALFPHIGFLIIADHKPSLDLQSCEFLEWKKETEATDLMRIDIGIMPLPDDAWAKGKCGFKALQYMAMEIPCVVSSVGVNTRIIDNRENGFLAKTETDWINYLSELINEPTLRKKFGTAGRRKVINQYSVISNSATFLSLFQ